MAAWNEFVSLGFDEPLPSEKKRRVRESSLEERITWAARKLLGHTWEQIARESGVNGSEPAAIVRKGATEVIKMAEWHDLDETQYPPIFTYDPAKHPYPRLLYHVTQPDTHLTVENAERHREALASGEWSETPPPEPKIRL